MKVEIEANKLLEELTKNSSNCVEKLNNNELKEVKDQFRAILATCDSEGIKKLKIISDEVNNELELIGRETIKSKNELSNMNASNTNSDVSAAYKMAMEKKIKVYVFSNKVKKDIPNELVVNHPESLLNANMIDLDSRISNHEIDIDLKFKHLEKILKYMKNEYDINELNGIEFVEFCRELMEMNIPFRMDIMNRIYTGSNKYGIRWKNRQMIVNGNKYEILLDYMNIKLSDLTCTNELNRVEYKIDDRYEPIIQAFTKSIKDPNSNYHKLIHSLDRKIVNQLINEGRMNMDNDYVRHFFYKIYSPYLKNTILFGHEYDTYLKEWLGNDYKWKLLYRASEHDYTASSFHEYCNDQGPTLVIIKSDKRCIFGGYTTQSWSGTGVSDGSDISGSIYCDFFFIHSCEER